VLRTASIRDRLTLCAHLLLPSPRLLAWVTRPRSPRLRATHRFVFRSLRAIERRVMRPEPDQRPAARRGERHRPEAGG
jgi:hypothetical protein